MKTLKIAIMGGGGAGKSCLTYKYTHDKFVDNYQPTIEDSYDLIVEILDKSYKVEILDSAGTGQFIAMRDIYIKDNDGFILVYSVVEDTTFDEVKEIYDNIIKIKKHGAMGTLDDSDFTSVPIILCASKCDLKGRRVVSTEEGKKIASDWGCPYVEVSSKTGQNVIGCFNNIFRQVIADMNQKELKQKQNKRKCCVML